MFNVFDLMFNNVQSQPISTLVLKKCAYIAAYIVLVSWECFKGMNGTLKMTILQTFKSASWCNSFKYRIMQRNNDSKKMRCGSKTEKVLLSRMYWNKVEKNLYIWSRKYLSLANDKTISSFTILKQNYVDVVMGCAIIKMRHFHPLRLAAYFWLKNSDFAKAAGAPFVIVSKLSATSLCGTVKPRFVLTLNYFHTICSSNIVILEDWPSNKSKGST